MDQPRDDLNEPVNEQVPTGSSTGEKSKMKTLGILLAIGIGMFGFAFANAEFFVMICQEAGLIAQDPEKIRGEAIEAEYGRPITVYFSGVTADNLPVDIQVSERMQRTKLNKREVVDYFITNLSDRTIYINPHHDVNPIRVNNEEMMRLEECFCFTYQKLEPGQRRTFPVVYLFTDDVPDNVRNIKMHYTIFETTKERYEESLAKEEQDIAEAKQRAKEEALSK